MFTSPTVFIVGAGASCEAGLPSGFQLASTIAKKLDTRPPPRHHMGEISGDPYIVDVIMHYVQQHGGGNAEYFNSCLEIREGLPLSNSIDEYMDSRKDDKRIQACGKIAIVASILAAEHSSKFHSDPFEKNDQTIFDNGSLDDTWYIKFFRMLSSGLDQNHVQSIFDNVSFVVFNYDRCIEFFLREALRKKYGISEESAQEVTETLKIFHPYGAVGSLPSQSPSGEVVQFGSYKLHPASLIKISEGIKTYTEEIKDGDNIKQLRAAISAAEAIVFLGFAFSSSEYESPAARRSHVGKANFWNGSRILSTG